MSFANVLSNSRGQALVETLFSLPALITGVTLVLGGLHSLFAFYLVDHWSYQAGLCLVMENQQQVCEQKFREQVRLLPFVETRIERFQRMLGTSQVHVVFDTPLIRARQLNHKIENQLGSHHFRSF